MVRGVIIPIQKSKNPAFRTIYIASGQGQIWDDFTSILIAKGHTNSRGEPRVSYMVLKLIEKYVEANFKLLKTQNAQTTNPPDKD